MASMALQAELLSSASLLEGRLGPKLGILDAILRA